MIKIVMSLGRIIHFSEDGNDGDVKGSRDDTGITGTRNSTDDEVLISEYGAGDRCLGEISHGKQFLK